MRWNTTKMQGDSLFLELRSIDIGITALIFINISIQIIEVSFQICEDIRIISDEW